MLATWLGPAVRVSRPPSVGNRAARAARATRATQRGAAIITALLVVMLAATISSILLAQQSEALTRVQRATERAQLNLFANTTLTWARTALLAQQKNSTYVSLGQPWAQGLVARPIETATAAGVLRDAQGKFNINNLVDGAGKRREEDAQVFIRLLKILKLDANIADAVVDWLDRDDDTSVPGGAENGYYWSQRPAYRAANRTIGSVDELRRVKGIDDRVFIALSPFITALPATTNAPRTWININTAPQEVLRAVLDKVSDDEIVEIIRVRVDFPFSTKDHGFKEIGGIKDRKTIPADLVDNFLDVKSRYFEADLAITGEASQVRLAALLQLQDATPRTNATALPVIIWVKEP